jgi:hypothetical protein
MANSLSETVFAKYVPQTTGICAGNRAETRGRYNGPCSGRRGVHMGDVCDLRAANGEIGMHCEGEACSFWRVAAFVGDGPGVGCASKYYELLGDDRVAAWLLSVKVRLDRAALEECAESPSEAFSASTDGSR